MKIHKIILVYLLLEISICSTVYKWKLDIVNEERQSEIKLTQGKFTKIYFVLTNATELIFPFLEEDSFILTFDDENIISLDKEIILTPKENLVYSTFIGLKCDNSITEDTYKIKIEVTPYNEETLNDLIEYSPIEASIKKGEFNIDLNILFSSMPKNSFNLFQLSEEPYNVDEIKIKVSEIKGFNFNDIVIKSFIEREKLYDESSSNHGFIFSSIFGLNNEEELTDKSFTLNLILESEKLTKCYNIPDKFTFSIEKDIPNINETLKKVVKYSFEDITEKYGLTTNFKIKTIIPEAPIMLTCSIGEKLLVPQKGEEVKPYSIYKNIITKSGDFIIEVNNLEFNSEYFANCEFSDTNYEDNKRNKINITIGNRENYDIFHQLKTTRESKRIPQCVKLTINKEKISEFKEVGPLICKYFMKIDEPFKITDLQTIVCEIVEADKENVTVCVSPSPKYSIEEYTKFTDNYNYNNSFNNFIEYVKNIYSAKITEDIEYDVKFNNPFYLSISKMKRADNYDYFVLDISSNYSQKIECFYSNEIKNDNNFKTVNYDIPVVFAQNTHFDDWKLTTNWKVENNSFVSLNFKCFNLPNFKFKYESIGYLNLYTYLITDKIDYYNLDQVLESYIFNNISINCNEKENKISPICLKKEKIHINKIIKTELPEFLKEVENKLEFFSKSDVEVKYYYLETLVQNYPKYTFFTPEIINLYFKKSIELLIFLSNIDCSHYFYSVNSNEVEKAKKKYETCRNKKQEGLQPIIKVLENILTFINDVDTILSQIGGKDLEENLKYILVFIKELTNNEDSYKKGWSSIVANFAIMLQEQFNSYWISINKEMKNDTNYLVYIEEVKKEVLLSIFEILTSIPRIIHYDEIDGYLNKAKMTTTGLILDETSIKVQNAIINSAKQLNKLKLNLYLSDYTFFENILSSNEEKTIIKIGNGIYLEINPKYLLSTQNAASLQIFIFDSPLVTLYPHKKPEKTSNTLNHFISITILNETGGEIPIKNIESKKAPKILYRKDKFEVLKGCYYFDEKNHLLKYDEITLDEDYIDDDINYYKCESNHLTMFTAGTNKIIDEIIQDDEDDSTGLGTFTIILILLGIVILLSVLIAVIAHCRKNKINSDNIDSNFEKNDEGLMKEELY